MMQEDPLRNILEGAQGDILLEKDPISGGTPIEAIRGQTSYKALAFNRLSLSELTPERVADGRWDLYLRFASGEICKIFPTTREVIVHGNLVGRFSEQGMRTGEVKVDAPFVIPMEQVFSTDFGTNAPIVKEIILGSSIVYDAGREDYPFGDRCPTDILTLELRQDQRDPFGHETYYSSPGGASEEIRRLRDGLRTDREL